MPDGEVTVVFNVSASAGDSLKLAVSASTPQAIQLPVSAGLTGDLSSAISVARGNVVTVKFTNLLFAPQNQLLTMKSADEIGAILKTLKAQGVVVYLQR
jgi:hypothetical protein